MRTLSLPFLRVLCWIGVLLASPAVRGQVSISAPNAPYTQNFNTLAASGLTNDISTLPAGWTFLETGTGANTTYAAGTGSSNSGNTYSFGTDAGDRALGGLQSGSVNPTIGAAFVNNTGNTITQLSIRYAGEQWRLGTAGRADRLDFQYSLDATSLATGTWTDVDALDFSSPTITATVGALNGNDTLNRRIIAYTLNGLSIANGDTVYIRWNDFNAASSDDGLAVDDFSLTATGNIVASLAFAPAALNFGNVNVGESRILTYTVTGTNLTAGITLSTAAPFALSTDSSATFATTATLPATGGKVWVRFSPTTTGAVTATVLHQSGSLQQNYSLNGTGFDQVSSIIPIAQARRQAQGTLVTVAGRVTVANQFGSPSYVQDTTGGIPVFFYSLSNSVAIGDSVIVTGPIDIFNNQVQIGSNGTFFRKVDAPSRIITPKAITLDQLAAYEGQLVTVSAEFVNKNFVLLPDNTQQITAGGVQADLRIDGDTDLPGLLKPQTAVNITGVVGRFRTNAQLLPRFQADVPGTREPAAESDTLSKDQTFDVVTWNIEWFNSPTEGPENDALQLANVKKVIQRLDADVYAFEEVANDSAFAALTAQLPGYKSFGSPYYSYYFDPNGIGKEYQKIYFLYKTATVDSVSSKPLLKDLFESVRNGNTALLPNYPGEPASFWASGRLPFLFEFDAKIGGQTKRIHLVDIHARANSGTDVTRYNRRKYDVELLKDTLDAQYGNANLILVGDYNDDVDVSVVNNLPSSFEEYVQDSADYRVLTLPLSEEGYFSYVPSASFLDHITISNELVDSYLENSIRVVTPFDSIRNYVNTTSDHIPVAARFRFKPETCVPSVSILASPAGPVWAGTKVTLQAQVINGGANPSFQWFRNGAPIAGATDSTYSGSNWQRTDTIRVVLTSSATCANGNATVSSAPVVIPVITLPTVSITGLPAAVCANAAPIALAGSPAGGRFTVDGVPATVFNPAGVTTGSLVVYTYTDSASGCTNSASQVVLVNPAPAANAGQDQTVYSGFIPAANVATLTGSATGGSGAYQYLWSTGARTATIQVSPVRTTTYTLTVTDASGCTSQDQVTVRVEDVRCGFFGLRVAVCYKGQSFCVSRVAAAIWLAKGATLGACGTGNTVAYSGREGDVEATVSPDVAVQFEAAPNPFDSRSTLQFSVPTAGRVALEIYDVRGTLVQRAFEGQAEAGRVYQVELDGKGLSDNLYIGRLITEEGVKTIKLIRVK